MVKSKNVTLFDQIYFESVFDNDFRKRAPSVFHVISI